MSRDIIAPEEHSRSAPPRTFYFRSRSRHVDGLRSFCINWERPLYKARMPTCWTLKTQTQKCAFNVDVSVVASKERLSRELSTRQRHCQASNQAEKLETASLSRKSTKNILSHRLNIIFVEFTISTMNAVHQFASEYSTYGSTGAGSGSYYGERERTADKMQHSPSLWTHSSVYPRNSHT